MLGRLREAYNSGYEDVEALRLRFEEFRRTRLPEELMARCGADRGAARMLFGVYLDLEIVQSVFGPAARRWSLR